MHNRKLYLCHTLTTSKPKSVLDPQPNHGSEFVLATCQRTIALGFGPQSINADADLQVLSGWRAYALLLRVASGLESRVLGESDVFGQIRKAWHHYQLKEPDHAKLLQRLFRQLFEDTKAIRTQYVQGLGGNSYGSLIRRILRPTRNEPVLIIGTGRMAADAAHSMRQQPLLACGRSTEKLAALKMAVPNAAITGLFDETSLREAWQSTRHVVLAVPNTTSVSQTLARWHGESPDQRKLVHLGCQDHDLGDWSGLPNLYSLTKIFQLHEQRTTMRQQQLTQARRACEGIAKVRELGSPCWDDLEVFAC